MRLNNILSTDISNALTTFYGQWYGKTLTWAILIIAGLLILAWLLHSISATLYTHDLDRNGYPKPGAMKLTNILRLILTTLLIITIGGTMMLINNTIVITEPEPTTTSEPAAAPEQTPSATTTPSPTPEPTTTTTKPSTPTSEPTTSTSTTATRDEIENAIREYQPTTDDAGTYRPAIRKLAEIADTQLTWSLNNLPQECKSYTGDLNTTTNIAVYCNANGDTIYINETRPDYSQLIKDKKYLDFMKHEIAHKLIVDTCQTTNPDIANGRYEAVTNSYAIKYLGANADTLNNEYINYNTDEETDAIAEAIHNNQCTTSTTNE